MGGLVGGGGDMEGGYGGGGEREIIIYLSLHCHHQNDSSIKVGSDGAILMSFSRK